MFFILGAGGKKLIMERPRSMAVKCQLSPGPTNNTDPRLGVLLEGNNTGEEKANSKYQQTNSKTSNDVSGDLLECHVGRCRGTATTTTTTTCR